MVLSQVLKIGPIVVDPPVVLAPMAGVTNVAFRRLCRRFGGGLYVSEMISARAVVEGDEKTMAMAAFAPDEPVRSVQLYGVCPDVIRSAVHRLVDEVGVDHVDLNFGCPAAKVTRKGGGAALPVHRVLFRSIVRAAVLAAGGVPVTVKLRIGVDAARITAFEAARAAEDEGAAAVALHARTAEQLYSGAADWSAIAALTTAVTSIPVLGNGDIWEAADALRMMDETGCDGVVVGRGCLGRPWLFRDLNDAFGRGSVRGSVPEREQDGERANAAPPSRLGEVAAVMREHARLLAEAFGGARGAREFRKHTGWYLTGFPVGRTARAALAQVSSLAELDAVLAELDPAVELPESARRLPRGHTNGPRPVAVPEGWFDHPDDPTPPVGADVLVSGG